MPSPQQDAIIAHPKERHGRVLAGPGTGKSTTVLRLAAKLVESEVPVQVITFTRAATAELLEKIQTEGHKVGEPATVHSFSLSLLLRNPGVQLPQPIRIPDEWETDNLIHPDIAKRLRLGGFSKKTGFSKNANVRDVERLEREMAAGWESMNPQEVLLADIDPALRSLYLSTWQAHRAVFGYSLFAEMPLYAKQLVEDRSDANLGDLKFLIVDEYQDLNRCEIGFLEALSKRGVNILSVGDDDQSIYSWRMADPSGIREFAKAFAGPAGDYSLSVSFRCGKTILSAARKLIEAMPGRPSKPALQEGPSNPAGVFKYLRFWDQVSERVGIARLAKHLIDVHGVKPADIAVLMRTDGDKQWSTPLRDALAVAKVPATNVEAALEPLNAPSARKLLAVGRLAVRLADDLAWWTLLQTTGGVSEDFIRALSEVCRTEQVRFGARVLTLRDDPPSGVTKQSLKQAVAVVEDVLALVKGAKVKTAPSEGEHWGIWLVDAAGRLSIPLEAPFRDLVLRVGAIVPATQGLGHLLNQLEPVARDLALKTPGVAIMTMGRSKGLTFRATFVMGVEEGVVPFAKAKDPDEERRLLYVAMTRAREFLFLTMASRRTDRTGWTGQALQRDRSRCPFFSVLGIGPEDGEPFLNAPSCC